MKLIFSFLILIISLESCTNRKQRDTRKLSWFEIAADAKNKEVTVLVDNTSLEQWNSFYTTVKDSLTLKFNIEVIFKGIEQGQINDSLEDLTKTDLVMCSGRDLEKAMNEQLLFGPFDKLMPYKVMEFANIDSYRFSDGIATKGFAVPIKAIKRDSVSVAFLAIPIQTKNQAAALVVLNALLHAAEKAVLLPTNE